MLRELLRRFDPVRGDRERPVRDPVAARVAEILETLERDVAELRREYGSGGAEELGCSRRAA